jgi:hypothetical protein
VKSDLILQTQSLYARVIAVELNSVNGTEAVALPTLKKWRQSFMEGRTSLCRDSKPGRPLANDRSEAIASTLKGRPSILCKVWCRHFRIAKASSLRIVHNSFGTKEFSVCSVLYGLDVNQKSEQGLHSPEVLAMSQNDRSRRVRNVITGDGSWFFLCYPHEPVRE